MITVKSISTEEFARSREEWNALLNVSRACSPMLKWEWMFSWWECYRSHEVSRTLYVLSVRLADGELVGLLPMVRRPYSEYGIRSSRLEFIGTGEPEEDETCSEFLDVLTHPDHEQQVLDALAGHLASDNTWDEIVCRDTPADGSVFRGVAEALRNQAGIRQDSSASGECPFISLPNSWEEYLASISAKKRERIAYERRRLNREHTIRYTSVADVDGVNRHYADFVRLHRVKWSAAGKTGCFSSAVFSDFLDRATGRSVERNGIQISYLTVDDEVVAAYYLLRHKEKLYYYNSGMEVGRYDKFSLGNITIGFIIEEAIAEGFREFHFFKGGRDSYKTHWAKQAVPLARITITRKSPAQNMKSVLDTTANRIRRLRKLVSRKDQ